MEDQIAEEVKSERLARLQALIASQARDFNRACVGRVLPVLFERTGRHSGQLVGRSPYLQGVHVDGPDSLIGSVADVAIEAAHANSLSGRLAEHGAGLRRQSREASMERASA